MGPSTAPAVRAAATLNRRKHKTSLPIFVGDLAGLNEAIIRVNGATSGDFTIAPINDINLNGAALQALNLQSGVTLSISVSTVGQLNDAILVADAAVNGTVTIELAETSP